MRSGVTVRAEANEDDEEEDARSDCFEGGGIPPHIAKVAPDVPPADVQPRAPTAMGAPVGPVQSRVSYTVTVIFCVVLSHP